MIITFDPLNEIQHSLVHWKAFAKALLFEHHPLPIRPHNQRTKSQNPHGLTIPKKRNSLSENVTRKIYYHKTCDANTYSQAKLTPLRESRSMLMGHHSSKLH
jgi:hypothetical protein